MFFPFSEFDGVITAGFVVSRMFISMVHPSFTVTPHTFDSTSRVGFQFLGRIHFGKQFLSRSYYYEAFFIP
jgi:hypothetical protein